MPEYEVLGVGTPVIDHILKVDSNFVDQLGGEREGMVPVDAQTFDKILQNSGATNLRLPGGSCANAIRGLAHLDHPCAFVGKIGNDSAGKYFTRELERLGIAPLLGLAKANTAQVISLVEPNGQRTMRSLLNASSEMSAKDLHAKDFKNIKLLHLEGYLLMNGALAETAMKYAKQAGALVSFDLGSFEMVQQFREQILKLLEKYVDIVFANEIETHALTNEADSKKGCAFLKEHCKIAVVMRGKKGCVVGSEAGIFEGKAHPVEDPLDTTGAGDLFASGFLHGYLKGWSLEKSADLGAILGAEVVKVPGTDIPPEAWKAIRTKYLL